MIIPHTSGPRCTHCVLTAAVMEHMTELQMILAIALRRGLVPWGRA